ncbi:Uncharacterised protein [Vibrio cholerae]|nr:Uncharacterised protein [Vibrio cholerae]
MVFTSWLNLAISFSPSASAFTERSPCANLRITDCKLLIGATICPDSSQAASTESINTESTVIIALRITTALLCALCSIDVVA